MAFDMIAAEFVDGPVGLAQGNDKIMRADDNQKLPPGVKPARRIVCWIAKPASRCLVERRPVARRAHRSRAPRLRVAAHVGDRRHARENRPRNAAPAAHARAAGRTARCCNVVTFPPDAGVERQSRRERSRRLFSRAWARRTHRRYSPQAPHPYMQKTRTLDFGIVLEGEIVLVLDTQEVTSESRRLRRAARHQPRVEQPLDKPAVVAIASHDGAA